MPTRVLVIADDTFDTGDRVPTCIEQLGTVDEVEVVAPIIASRTDTLLEDDDAYREAQERAERVAEAFRERGVEASSDFSEDGPLNTAVTRLQAGSFDGVVVAVTDDGHWREEGVLDELRDATTVPVTTVGAG